MDYIFRQEKIREDKFGLDLRMDSSALLQCLIIGIETFDEMNLHILTMSFLERTSFYSKGMFTTWTSHFFSFNENTAAGTSLEALIVSRIFTSAYNIQSQTQPSAPQCCQY